MRKVMLKQKILIAGALLLTAGCTIQPTGPDGTAGQIDTVPEAVVALAAPDQNVATARLLPDDNCYWYEHNGPVETTLLPLTTPNGNPICLARES